MSAQAQGTPPLHHYHHPPSLSAQKQQLRLLPSSSNTNNTLDITVPSHDLIPKKHSAGVHPVFVSLTSSDGSHFYSLPTDRQDRLHKIKVILWRGHTAASAVSSREDKVGEAFGHPVYASQSSGGGVQCQHTLGKKRGYPQPGRQVEYSKASTATHVHTDVHTGLHEVQWRSNSINTSIKMTQINSS